MVWIVFALGIANFYFHRAVLDGRDPAFAEIAEAMNKLGWGTYALEFAILVAALWFARQGDVAALLFYGCYSAINIGGYYMIRQMKD